MPTAEQRGDAHEAFLRKNQARQEHRYDGTREQREIARLGRRARKGAFGKTSAATYNTIGTSAEKRDLPRPKVGDKGQSASDIWQEVVGS